MFLVDSAVAASDWEGINSFIKSILEKAEAQIISIRKWDERKLTYDIDKKSRGTYILCYFTAPTLKISQIERDIRLSERIMRVLILRGEHLTKEDMEKETPLMIAQREGTVGQAGLPNAAHSMSLVRIPLPETIGLTNTEIAP